MTKHKTGTREEWLAARLELLRREGADAARRRAGAAAAGAAVGSDRQGVSVRDRRGERLAGDLFRGRSQLLVYTSCSGPTTRRGVRPARRSRTGSTASSSTWPTTTSRSGGVAGAAREAAGVQAADGLDVSLGVLVRQRLQLRLPRLVHRGAAARGRRRIQLPARAGRRTPVRRLAARGRSPSSRP